MLLSSVRKNAKSITNYPRSPTVLTLNNPSGWLPDDAASISVDEAQKLSAYYRGVNYICNFFAPLPCYIFNRNTRERDHTHRLDYVLSIRPNDAQTPSDFTRFLVRELINRGNAYAYSHRDPRTGYIVERIPLPAAYVTVRRIAGKLTYFYTEPSSGCLYALGPNDVTHYKLNSDDGVVGVSPLRYAARDLQRAVNAASYESAVYINNSRPGGVLETDTDLGGLSQVPDPDQPGQFLTKKENVRRAWERAHGGGAKAFRVAVLDNGLKYNPIKVDAYDESFIKAKDVSIADIARFLGVPLHALMTGKQSYQSNEQNALEFVQGDGLAILKTMEQEDSYKLLLDSELAEGWVVRRNLDARLRGDTKTRAEWYKAMREIGYYSVNDICEKEDRPDVPGGDTRQASLNYVPLEDFAALSRARNNPSETEE